MIHVVSFCFFGSGYSYRFTRLLTMFRWPGGRFRRIHTYYIKIVFTYIYIYPYTFHSLSIYSSKQVYYRYTMFVFRFWAPRWRTEANRDRTTAPSFGLPPRKWKTFPISVLPTKRLSPTTHICTRPWKKKKNVQTKRKKTRLILRFLYFFFDPSVHLVETAVRIFISRLARKAIRFVVRY